MSVLAPVVIGFFFGVCLQKAGLSRYERIVGIYRFVDFAVLRFLLSALVTAAVILRVVATVHPSIDVPVPATYAAGNLLGGAIFGIGMALSGFCPGTIASGAGEGRLDYLVAGGLGLYAGAVIYGVAYEKWMPKLSRVGRLGNATLAGVMHVEPWLVIALLLEVGLLTLHFVNHPRHTKPSAT